MPLASSPMPLSSGFWLLTKICCNEEVITVANTASSVFEGESGVPAGAPKYIAGGGKVFQPRDDALADKMCCVCVRRRRWTASSSLNWRPASLQIPSSFVLKRLSEKKELVIVCHWPLKKPRLIGAAAPQQALFSFVIQEVVYCRVENQYFNSPVFSRSF